ncbi:MAG: peroxide stress protein YaaA [Candidatus Peribacteria bacterium]|nr:MAG: peroxide stress protein YaaA [Candidatus Peribacteria bacterium]
MLYLIPPSEGKEPGGWAHDAVSPSYELPREIATHATPKDLKCKDQRYEEAMQYNITAASSQETFPAIQRYTGIMFKAIDYWEMSIPAQNYFNEQFLIVSGLW